MTFDDNTIGSYAKNAYSIVESAPISNQSFTNNHVVGQGLNIGIADPAKVGYRPRNVTITGKSVNAIRVFAGKGCLVWGARTLAGNDNEWRYVPVRRFFNMAEESIKKATEPFVFGGIISLVACYYGLKTTGGTEGVGVATTRTVVTASTSPSTKPELIATVAPHCVAWSASSTEGEAATSTPGPAGEPAPAVSV